MWQRLRWFFPVLVLGSCGIGDPEAEMGPDPFGSTGIPPTLRGGAGYGGTPLKPGGITESMRNNPGVVLNQEEIVYTDPDAEDPDSIPEELSRLLNEGPQEGPWGQSYTEAFKKARRLEKPVLIWFTDSQNSVNCKMLSEELFNDAEFDQWANETFVRLRVDSRVTGKDNNEESRRKSYIKDLKKRFKVRGVPLLVVLAPSEDVIGRYKGYNRGQANFKWGQLRQAAKLAAAKHKKWIAKLEKKGYRTWKDPLGRQFFAKLVLYRDGELILVQPDGTRARTKEKRLSPNDQDWIAEQKRARGIE